VKVMKDSQENNFGQYLQR